MFEFQPIRYADDVETKRAFYREVESEVAALMESTWWTNLASASAVLNAHLPRLNWVGFYLNVGEQLVLGPFQGLPACLRIPFGKGVCGTAASTRVTQRVRDVHAFPGHIACDARSRSEIVVPLVVSGRVLGVLDLDSPEVDRFDEEDQRGLESIAALLSRAAAWPASLA